MKPAKVTEESAYQKVWESLCEHQDPETPLAQPSWLKMRHSIGVCRQRIAEAIKMLKFKEKLEVITKPRPHFTYPEYF